MRTVELVLPAGILAELGLEDEGLRGSADLSLVVNGLGLVSSLVTVASLRSSLPALARRIRVWAGVAPAPVEAGPEAGSEAGSDAASAAGGPGAQPAPGAPPATATLTIRGPEVLIEVPLPPNVSAADIIRAVSRALDSLE